MKRERSSMRISSSSHPIDSLIGERASFNGELNFEGAVRIDGKFEGNIRSHNEGTLIISETAMVAGDVDVPNLILHGAIRGNVHAGKNLQIGSTGRLNGDVEYTVLTLAEGATINGRCNRIEDKERVKQAAKANAPVRKAEQALPAA